MDIWFPYIFTSTSCCLSFWLWAFWQAWGGTSLQLTSNVKYLFMCLSLFVGYITKRKNGAFSSVSIKILPQPLVAIKMTCKSLCYCYRSGISIFGCLMHVTYSLEVTLNGSTFSSYSELTVSKKQDKILLIIRIRALSCGRDPGGVPANTTVIQVRQEENQFNTT